MRSKDSDGDDFGWDQVNPHDEGDPHLWMKAEHLAHYLFAADFLKPYQPTTVADISCGIGYGIPELLRAADAVIGVDSSPEMLEIASKNCDASRVRFLRKDLDSQSLTPEIAEGTLDAVVSFETLEHLVDPSRAVSQFSQALRPGGFLICSVPNQLYEPKARACLPRNKNHKGLFGFGSLSRLVKSHGLQVLYRLGQAWSYTLLKREQQLYNAKLIRQKLSEVPVMNSPEILRLLSYIVAYPTVDDAEGSYSIIIVAKKPS